MKKTFASLLFLLSIHFSYSQNWFQTYGLTNGEGGSSVPSRNQVAALCPDGGTIAVANFRLGDNGLNIDLGFYMLKTDENGSIMFEKKALEDLVIAGEISSPGPRGLQILDNGNFLVNGSCRKGGEYHIFLAKFDASGNRLWIKTYGSSWSHRTASALGIAPNGDIVMYGTGGVDGDIDSPFIMKTNPEGEEIWSTSYLAEVSTLPWTIASDLIVEDNGDIVFTGYAYDIYGEDKNSDLFVAKLNSAGVLLWATILRSPNIEQRGYTLTSSPLGGYLVAGISNHQPFCIKVDDVGNLIWQKLWTTQFGELRDVVVLPNNEYLLVGAKNKFTDYDCWVFQIDDLGNETYYFQYGTNRLEVATSVFLDAQENTIVCGYANTDQNGFDIFLMNLPPIESGFSVVEGRVTIDINLDCLSDATETPLAGLLVRGVGENLSFSVYTDSNGHYSLPILFPNNYEIQITNLGVYSSVCNNNIPIVADIAGLQIDIDFSVQNVEECPLVEVSMTAPFLRRCFENTYTVQYCNYGRLPAEGAYIEISLDTFLTYQSSSIPLANQNGNKLSFDLGTVEINECGNFQVTAYLDCDSTVLGQTHCSEAHVFPDSLCFMSSALWDNSNVEVDAECVGDSVIFTIQNEGSGDMTQQLNYIILEDEDVMMEGIFQLDAGQFISISLFGNGSTFHLEAEQSPKHPSGASSTGASIEGCDGWVSLGFFTQFSNSETSPFLDIDCQQNIDSYDANGKQAFPVGFGDAHLIEPETDIEYLIRFQNTVADTAYNVVIVDLLREELDFSTLRPGASSHAYEYSISPEGWPIFTFNNINLPRNTTNEPASRGFVRFKISQAEGNGNGTYINNTAYIHIDIRPPIKTNIVSHSVGQIFPWTYVDTENLTQVKPQVRIMPNPLTDSVLLQLKNTEPGLLHLLLVTPGGQVVRDEKAFGTGFELQRGTLPSGIYFFKITRDGSYVGSGKLMVL
ncbi:MAG: carboxypeptidase-like regulatory domain-containing protein [Saprospiraceae bacterium]